MQVVIRKGLIIMAMTLGLSVPTVASSDVLVGAYYYPWYGPTQNKTSQTIRTHLKPAHDVQLGLYDSLDPAIIKKHAEYSVQANIGMWASSWWGPNRRTNEAFKTILNHPEASKLKHAIMYEATGRLGRMDRPNYSRLVSDFKYFKEEYFSHPSYFKIDGKPVVFIYLTRVYFRDQKGLDALARLRKEVPEVYLIGDEIFSPGYSAEHAKLWDAVTAYDVYGQTMSPMKNSRKAMDLLERIYVDAQTSSHAAGAAFVPFVAPGYNDRIIRDHNAAPRYFADDKNPKEGDVFRAMLEKAILRVDPKASNLLMVTSFNEWHEDSQIEPTAGTGGTTTQDDSDSGTKYTQGYKFVDYGELYLDILREETTKQAKAK